MIRRASADRELLTGPEGHRVVYLMDTSSDLEKRMLEKWIAANMKGPVTTERIASSRRGTGGDRDSLRAHLNAGDDPYFIPVRVVWMPRKRRSGRRSVGWLDAFRPGDPRDPKGLRALWIKTFRKSRVKPIAAPGASASRLARDYESSGEVDGTASFVTRRAWLALDQVERKLQGNRYKIPRFVAEVILSRREFLDNVDDLIVRDGLDQAETYARAEKYLREIAATHSPYVIDLVASAIHALYTQGYGAILYDQEEVLRVGEEGRSHPVVFLPSHRSNLDRLALQFMLWENDFPPNHTAGGINMNFFPIGPLLRRTGVFFIRRSFKDDDLYKTVLRAYLDYLVEKRFPLEWYLEGGRSRSGRLRPPRFGLLNYVVDSLRRGKSDDVSLIPVSIVYDHIQDVPDYAREAQGKGKDREGLVWFIKSVRAFRRRYGNIHIRFGEPVSVAAELDRIEPGEEVSIGLQKLAFEVMYRVGRVTPITPTAVVSIALLEARGSAKTAAELAETCKTLAEFLEARDLPRTEQVDFGDAGFVTGVLDWLGEHSNVSSHEALGRRVFWLDDDQMLRVSYYRNVVVHFFVHRAIAEIALTSVEPEEAESLDAVRDRMLALRDLLKFEFFFPEKEQFLREVSDDVAVDVPDWESVLASGGTASVAAKMGAPVAHWAVLPFLDAYRVVGDELESLSGPFDEKEFLADCLSRARMYRIEERLISGESASVVLFRSALHLAENRGLLEDSPGVDEQRASFASDLRTARNLAAASLNGSL
ncbi:MAG: 1-acyl-sn-glycerol-3-phosphate acyltransferase [Acidimicrobiia bacterium]|nr:1-acyl-sn-glycerol-3-phosphate acyltransferase [Acidimicrobiia bacterium]